MTSARCVIVTNIPSPYRNPVYSLLPADEFMVLFCSRTEGNRQWQLAPPTFPHLFLSGRVSAQADGYNFIHDNPQIWAELNRLRPAVVVTTGMNPTHLRAFAWSKLHRTRHVYQTDGTVLSEAGLSWRHGLIRRGVIPRSDAGIAASSSGRALLASYGLRPENTFLSQLCADNERFTAHPIHEREFEVMFSGQLHERKLPMLFVDTCIELRRRRGRCRALVLGDGPMRDQVIDALARGGVDYCYPGFVQPEDLPQWYSRSRLLLFTTRLDPWGVVANEAMAAGTPVLTTPYAGAAGDLVIDGLTGRVLPTDPVVWADACQQLLESTAAWQQMSTLALQQVRQFTYALAAQGIQAACAHALR